VYWTIAALITVLVIANACAGQEVALTHWWADAAFLGQDAPPPIAGPGLEIVRQAHGTFRLNRSVWDAPLRIGGREYPHGLGTHATSEIRACLPGRGRRFMAEVGVDDNPNTRSGSPSVVFAVEAGGKEEFRSPVLRVADGAMNVGVALGGAESFTLRVLDGGDGESWDQADWAAARVELEDGRTLHLDELPVLRGPTEPVVRLPFSFLYGGRPSGDLLPLWERTITREEGGLVHRVSFRDPETGLRVTATVRRFAEFPALDWVLEFANEGPSDTPELERVLPLDLQFAAPPGELMRLQYARGSSCEITDFMPLERELKPGDRVDLAPVGGRSSNGTLPFLNADWGNGGALVGIGWSGQWAAAISRVSQTELGLQAGQETCRLRLRPGERIRTPRVLLVLWRGSDRLRSYHLLRRLLLGHYCPRIEGELVIPPIAYPTANSILRSGKPANEENQLEMLRAGADVGCEVFWLDAYWFPQGFPGGVGTWVPRPEDFPRGLRPLSDEAHRRGMRFLLWFEPERVARGSRIAREHPEFCLEAGPGDLLFNLGDPEARRFMTDLLSNAIEEHGIDIYREDFNIDPLPFWQAADEPGRQGMTEIGFVEGLYAMWDELVARHPGLAIDNCASGGRRIDLETVSRSYALWRSDFQDVGILTQPSYLGAAAIASQVQTVGLGLYVPFSTNALYSFDPYSFRSAMTAGVACYLDLRDPHLNREQARAAIAELKELRRYYLGDLYPLTPVTTSPTDWCAYQFDRPDLSEGIALFFRRHESPYPALDVELRGIDPAARYRWSLTSGYDRPRWRSGSGAELARQRVVVGEAPGPVLLRYRGKPTTVRPPKEESSAAGRK